MNENFHLETKVLNEILDKCKTHGVKCKTHSDKRGLGYINKDETPSSGETMFAKGKDETLNQTTSPKKPSLCIHCNKTRHSQFRCYTRFLERFESQMSMLMNDFNSLKK